MMSLRRFVVAALLATTMSCASSTPNGNNIDAGDGPSSDGQVADAPVEDSGAIDAAVIDAVVLDGMAVDAISSDAPNLDAAMVDAHAVDAMAVDAMAVDARAIDAATDAHVIDAATDARVIDAATDANTCPTQPCDLHAQCGCTSPLVCDVDTSDLVGTQCRAVTANGTETSTCTTPSGCASGHVCVPSSGGSSCEKYCNEDSDCGQPRGRCVVQLYNGTTPVAGATTCSANCNPVNSAAGGCPAAWKCGFFMVNNPLTNNVNLDVLDCTTPGTGVQGTPCSSDATCASNYLCTTATTETSCRRVCNRTTGGNECASIPGTTCGGFDPALVVGGIEYGICL